MSRRLIRWWSSLMYQLTLMLTMSLYLPWWGTPTPTPLSAIDPTSFGFFCFHFRNLLPWLYYEW